MATSAEMMFGRPIPKPPAMPSGRSLEELFGTTGIARPAFQRAEDVPPRPQTDIDQELTKVGVSLFFSVEITNEGRNHFDLGHWMKVEGLDVQWELAEHRTGDGGNYRWAFPGVPKYSPLKLTRFITPTRHTQLRGWLESNSFASLKDSAAVRLFSAQNAAEQGIKSYEGRVNGNGGPRIMVAEWVLEAVVPTKYSVIPFDASSTKLVTETLELAHVGWLSSDNRIG